MVNEQQNLSYPGYSNSIYKLNSSNEDDEHFIETVYYIHLKLVLSDTNMRTYTRQKMSNIIQVSFSCSGGGVHFIE